MAIGCRWRKLCRHCRLIWRAPRVRRFSMKLNKCVFSLLFGRSPVKSRPFACTFLLAFFSCSKLCWKLNSESESIPSWFQAVLWHTDLQFFASTNLIKLYIFKQCPANFLSPLPHALYNESVEVCLFTRDEPNMTPDQTERFYKKLLTQSGVKFMPQVCDFFHLYCEICDKLALQQTLSCFIGGFG